MTQSPDSRSTTSEVGPEQPRSAGPNRPMQILTWVGIASGVVFVAAVIYLAGAATGWFPGWPYHGTAAACMMEKADHPMGPMAPGKDCCAGMKAPPAAADCCQAEKK